MKFEGVWDDDILFETAAIIRANSTIDVTSVDAMSFNSGSSITLDPASANVEVKLTTGERFLIDQDGNFPSLEIDSEATTGTTIQIPSPATTTGNVFEITGADDLTTGSLAVLQSGATDTSNRSLVFINNTNAASTGTFCLNVQNASTGPNILLSGANREINSIGGDLDITTDSSGDVVLNPAEDVILDGGQQVKRTALGAGSSTLGVNDYLIGKTAITAAGDTLTLPSAATIAGKVYVIKDESGNAGTDNITIATQAAETIDGQATFVINANYNSVTVYSDGTNWFVM